MFIVKYYKTAQMSVSGKTNGGVFYLLPDIFMKIIYLIPLIFLWKAITEVGYEIEMTAAQLLSYTYINTLLGDMMIVRTYMSAWNFDSRSVELFLRPVPVFGQVISYTIGEWVPNLLLFSLPMALLAPFFGIQVLPQTAWALFSLLLCVSLGFAFEFVFLCITIRLHNLSWLTSIIRQAIVSFFSGTVIPFRILPFGLDKWICYQPFGSLGGAVLSLYVGNAEPKDVIPVQIFWNIVIWTIATIWFQRSRERMVSFGG